MRVNILLHTLLHSQPSTHRLGPTESTQNFNFSLEAHWTLNIRFHDAVRERVYIRFAKMGKSLKDAIMPTNITSLEEKKFPNGMVIHNWVVTLALLFIFKGCKVRVSIEFIQYDKFIGKRCVAALSLMPAMSRGTYDTRIKLLMKVNNRRRRGIGDGQTI